MSVLRMPDPLLHAIRVAVFQEAMKSVRWMGQPRTETRLTPIDQPHEKVGERLTAGPWYSVDFVNG